MDVYRHVHRHAFTVPLFAMLVRKRPRRVFVPVVYRFFNVNLLMFYGLLTLAPDSWLFGIAVSFFIWVSVSNLFVVAVFWGFMADVFTNHAGKRLLGSSPSGLLPEASSGRSWSACWPKPWEAST